MLDYYKKNQNYGKGDKMAEFLSQDEIDALLDIAEQGEDIELSQEHKIIEILNFSADLVDSIQKKIELNQF